MKHSKSAAKSPSFLKKPCKYVKTWQGFKILKEMYKKFLMTFILPPDDYSLELKSGLSPVPEFNKMSEFYNGLNNFGKL